MDVRENAELAFEGLAANPLRSSLTMLGMVIGVLAVILGTAIGQGSTQQVLAAIEDLGSNCIMVFPAQQKRGAVMLGTSASPVLEPPDADVVERSGPWITAVAPQYISRAQIKFGNRNTNTVIVCTTPDYITVRNFAVQEGRFLLDRDVASMRKVCVLGRTTAQLLFGNGDPLGEVVRLQGVNFEVAGVMAQKGATVFGDVDSQVYIPLTTGMQQVFGANSLTTIFAQSASGPLSAEAARDIASALRARRHNSNAEDDFVVLTQEEFVRTQASAGSAFTLLLTGIAAVALLVGGIGIMNIMLVSVTERTREIGIRKAVGAGEIDILGQFLIEATILSVAGGSLGILAGIVAAHFVESTLGWPTAISWWWTMIAFSCSAAIGIFFGLYPAWKAARLDPVESLRYQ